MDGKTPRTIVGEYINASYTRTTKKSRTQSVLEESPQSPSWIPSSAKKRMARAQRSPAMVQQRSPAMVQQRSPQRTNRSPAMTYRSSPARPTHHTSMTYNSPARMPIVPKRTPIFKSAEQELNSPRRVLKSPGRPITPGRVPKPVDRSINSPGRVLKSPGRSLQSVDRVYYSPARSGKSPGRPIQHDRVSSLKSKRRSIMSVTAEEITPRSMVAAFLEGADSTMPILRPRARTSQSGTILSVPAKLTGESASTEGRSGSIDRRGSLIRSTKRRSICSDVETPRTLIENFLKNASNTIETPFVNIHRVNKQEFISPEVSLPSHMSYSTPSPFKATSSDKSTDDVVTRSLRRKTPRKFIKPTETLKHKSPYLVSDESIPSNMSYHTPSPFKSPDSAKTNEKRSMLSRKAVRGHSKTRGKFLLDIPEDMVRVEKPPRSINKAEVSSENIFVETESDAEYEDTEDPIPRDEYEHVENRSQNRNIENLAEDEEDMYEISGFDREMSSRRRSRNAGSGYLETRNIVDQEEGSDDEYENTGNRNERKNTRNFKDDMDTEYRDGRNQEDESDNEYNEYGDADHRDHGDEYVAEESDHVYEGKENDENENQEVQSDEEYDETGDGDVHVNRDVDEEVGSDEEAENEEAGDRDVDVDEDVVSDEENDVDHGRTGNQYQYRNMEKINEDSMDSTKAQASDDGEYVDGDDGGDDDDIADVDNNDAVNNDYNAAENDLNDDRDNDYDDDVHNDAADGVNNEYDDAAAENDFNDNDEDNGSNDVNANNADPDDDGAADDAVAADDNDAADDQDSVDDGSKHLRNVHHQSMEEGNKAPEGVGEELDINEDNTGVEQSRDHSRINSSSSSLRMNRSSKSGLNQSTAVPDSFAPAFTSTQQPPAERNEPGPEEEDMEYEDVPDKEPEPQVKKKVVRKPRQKSNYSLPVSLVKKQFTHFAPMRVSKEAIEEVMKASEIYWDNLASDLQAYALHAGRKTITMADFHLLFKRQGFVNDKVSLYSLIEKYLPMEERRKLIPVARAGNRIELLK